MAKIIRDTEKTGKPGRPAFTDPGSVRSESVKVRFTEAEVAMIKEKGEQMGLGVSPFIRMIMITYLNLEMLPGPQGKLKVDEHEQ